MKYGASLKSQFQDGPWGVGSGHTELAGSPYLGYPEPKHNNVQWANLGRPAHPVGETVSYTYGLDTVFRQTTTDHYCGYPEAGGLSCPSLEPRG
jgi:hypothetical protein